MEVFLKYRRSLENEFLVYTMAEEGFLFIWVQEKHKTKDFS